jgi:hypothetical protein
MSDLEDLRIINEMTYIVWLHSVYFIMGSVQESLSNHVQHPFENRIVELRWLEFEGTVKICSSYQ